MTRINLPSLTILRGPAALFVFIYHILHNTSWIPAKQVFSVGFVGVSLFFVLSGFVLTWSYNPKQSKQDFYLRRFSRVYPLHLAFLLVAVFVPVVAGARDPLKFLLDLLLLQAWVPNWDFIFSFNSVSWSLACEAFFYAMLPLFLPRLLDVQKRRTSLPLVALLALALAGIGSLLASQSNFLDVVVYANPLFRSAEFLLGVLLALAVKEVAKSWGAAEAESKKLALTLLAYGSFLLTLVAVYLVARLGLEQTISGYLLAPVFALLIGAFALKDLAAHYGQQTLGPLRQGLQKVLVYLGEISFAFYLSHELIIVNMKNLIPAHGGGLVGYLAAGLCLLLALAVSSLAHHLIEKPARRKILERF